MKHIVLDGKLMTSKLVTHNYIKSQLKIDGYYGNNLDALWDVLCYYDRPLYIDVVNINHLLPSAKEYKKSLLKLFADLSNINENIHFKIKNSA